MQGCPSSSLQLSFCLPAVPVLVFLKTIYLLDRERARRSRGRGRSRPPEQGAQCRTRSQAPEIMTWAEGRQAGAHPPSPPGPPSSGVLN